MSAFSLAPNPDQLALQRMGTMVRDRLNADPTVQRIDTDRAEIWAHGAFLSDQECDQLVAMVDRTAKPSIVMDHGQKEVWRTSSSGDVDPYDPLIRKVETRIDDLLGVPGNWGETMQGQRYQIGQEFKYHLDLFWTQADYWKDEARRGGQRSFTAMAYLNDVAEGGSTDFVNIGLSVPPQKGVLLIWNNAKPDGTINEDTMHAGAPVVAGQKYVLTKWYRTRRWG
ncbi:MAG TPA: 2OG-Fe(II) oxygenase [Novosphingobium sp.]|nr:2OG-Fe(II) oxygenase [Novosphingobium sp.]HQA18006.1 2OG-Fe(II) oxygenase [Novosphingobium sp.]